MAAIPAALQPRGTSGIKDDVERAIAFYYLIKNSFGSSIFNVYGYSKKGRFRYNTDFAKLAGIKGIKGRFILSYNDVPAISVYMHLVCLA